MSDVARGWYEWNDVDGPIPVHERHCPERPDRDYTGDLTAAGVQKADDGLYSDEFDLSCGCLDPILGSDRDGGAE
ncbi:hypothetical protein HSRCO_0759 [Halanaeroarchaeum sp. HSR-CO]|uniref:hypothetical protein n=1 Tax=Halanaeroarchaeum sp. HSR-CO TaxID=2866382 RepID=UPI00217E19FC|nr:hypothetical protein [Halanaeroarchaeum sp. HSR-CO]UWG47053.1 hypothetical protein HSRCO_0759 [Halanaeroarchaeum sp. HSR-CO]